MSTTKIFGFQFQFLVSVYPTDRLKVTDMQATTSNRFLLFEWVFFPSFYDRFLLQGLFVRYRALNRVSNHTTDYAAKRKYGIGSVKKQATQLFFSIASFLKLDPNIFGFRTHAHQSQVLYKTRTSLFPLLSLFFIVGTSDEFELKFPELNRAQLGRL